MAALLMLLVTIGCSGHERVAGTEPTSSTEESAWEDPIPLDPRITAGRLPNGVAYFVLPHRKPEGRAQLWLALNAGSALEDDDQRGLAHFVEHMAFNGTRRFPRHAIVDFLERAGMAFGPDLNASTTFDATTYKLQIPTHDLSLVDAGLRILRDWAGNVSFDPAELEAERGVVLEEWRRRRGAEARLRDRFLPVLLHGSSLADRLPVGSPDVIRSAPRKALLRFYRDWYRPDRMAVIVVGDLDASEVEHRIRAEFSDLRPHAPARLSDDPRLAEHAEPLVSLETDAERATTTIAIYTKLTPRSHRTPSDYRRALAEQLYHHVLNDRLDALRRTPSGALLGAVSWTDPIARDIEVLVQRAFVPHGGIEAGLRALLDELARIERHGFTARELARARDVLLRRLELAAARRDQRDARALAAEIARHFLEDRFLPGSDVELELARDILPELGSAELQSLLRTEWTGGRVIAVQGPDGATMLGSPAVLALVRERAHARVEPYRDRADGSLGPAPSTPGAVIDRHSIDEIGVTEWRLANGVRVVVKPTDFRQDDIRMLAFSPGGHSLADTESFDSAFLADVIVQDAGLGSLDPTALRHTLAGKALSIRVRIDELEERVFGSSAPEELETLFHLTHLAFTAPRRDETAFHGWRNRIREAVRQRVVAPERVFVGAMREVLSQGHPRRQPLTLERLGRVDLDRALAFYRDRFADASDFVFVLVGSIDLEELEPLVERYLGSLPADGREERWRDIGVQAPLGAQTKRIVKGREAKSRVMIAFRGGRTWSRPAEDDLRILVDVLRLQLRERLREELGAVYGVEVNGFLARRPRERFGVTIAFSCAPANAETLRTAVESEIRRLQRGEIDASVLAKIRAARARAHEVDLERNSFWLRGLARAYRFGDDPRELLDIGPALHRISPVHVESAARAYLDLDQALTGVLMPEVPTVRDPVQEQPSAALSR